MKKLSIALTAAALATAALSGGPAWATDGGTAVDMCKKLAGCVYDTGPRGDILILTGSGYIISCPSLTGECEVTARPDKIGTSPASGNGYQPPPKPTNESESSSGESAAPVAGNAYQPGPGPVL